MNKLRATVAAAVTLAAAATLHPRRGLRAARA